MTAAYNYHTSRAEVEHSDLKVEERRTCDSALDAVGSRILWYDFHGCVDTSGHDNTCATPRTSSWINAHGGYMYSHGTVSLAMNMPEHDSTDA